MNTLPNPAIVAVLAALFALPFSAPAAGTLLFTAALGFVIHADYVQRHRRIRLPRRARISQPVSAAAVREVHPLAA